MKKKLLPRLISLSMVGIFLIGCNNTSSTSSEKIELKLIDSYHGEYIIGQPIDVEFFFYCSKRNIGKITVSYEDIGGNIITENVLGNTFWPRITGEHLFTYVVDNQTISKTITVVDQKPTLNIDNYAYFAVPDSKIYFADIYSEISVDYTPSTAYLEVSKVEWSPFDFKISHGDYKFEQVSFKAKYFDGSKTGFYRIYVDVINGARTVSGVINAVISNDLKDGNKNVLKINNKYCSNKVVIDPENDNRYILPAARFNGASYVTFDGLNDNDSKHAIKFKGKQVPTIGLFTHENKITNSFSPYAISDGYLLSWEQRATHTYTVVRGSNGQEYKRAYVSKYYFGIDDLESDKYYLLTWSFDSHYSPEGHEKIPYLHVVRWEFKEIFNVDTPEEYYGETIFKIDAEGGWWDEFETTNGYTTIYSSSLQDITFEVLK